MTLRFLPWTRRGVAGVLDAVDDGGDLPARPAFPVTLTVNGADANADLAAYGPGDVTGLDLDTIVRTTPRRFATDAAPDLLVGVEFDPPDLPWMFTPAVAGPDQRLRPWLVLVVVTQGPGVSISAGGARPLPVLTIEAPSVPADEVPDLAESWAWAHTQVLAADATADLSATLADDDRTISRLLCPRRLRPGTSYYAALVPAFDAGVAAGLGEDASDGPVGPAWTRDGLGPTLRLPLYYHWEFTTGPAGDFEQLARRLRPVALPDSVGTAPLHLGEAHPALPALAPGDAVVGMDGALRSPRGGSGAEPGAALEAWTTRLLELVDAPAAAAQGGTPSGAEAVAPPVYGQWAADRHRVPAPGELPRWLRDLNADARHRVAAGLGAEVVRANQEEYVDAAWAQVGDVLAANGLLDLARMMSIVVTRVHTKHVVGIDPLRALDLVAPALRRVLLGGATVHDLVRRSAMPGGFGTRDFRRLVSPRSAPLRLAARRAGLPLTRSGGVDLAPLGRAASGALAPDLRVVPDGLRGSRLPELVDAGRITLPTQDRQLVEQLTGLVREHAGRLVGVVTPEIRLRPDLARSGVLVDRHLRAVRQGAGRHADLASGLAAIRAATAGPGGPGGGHLVGFVLAQGAVAPVSLAADGVTLSARLRDTTATLTVSPPQLAVPGAVLRPSVPPAVVAGPLADAVMRERIRLSADLLPGPVRPGPTVTPLPQSGTSASPRPVVGRPPLPVEALATDLGVTGQVVTIDAPLLVAAAVGAFAQSFAAARAASVVGAVPAPQPSPPLDIATLRDHLVEATRPTAMALRRAQARVTVQGRGLPATGAGGVGDVTWAQLHPMAPIMVGPVLDRPLYLDLARFDQERFLPGAGQIPDDAITLLETNPRFVESFLVGANHELNRELLWRRYPTDRRGTPLRTFWDRGPGGRDIEPVHTWSPRGRLGSHGAGDADGALVLLVRGQLLRRYPHTVVYAAPATPDRRIDPAGAPVLPVFAGHLAPDIVFVGFALRTADATAGNGTMFVLQEQPTEPRFGLDVPRGDEHAGTPPTTWSDLTWGHVGVAPGGHLSVAALDGSAARPLTEGSTTSVRFGRDAAHVAALTFQRPFRAAVHSSEVLD